MYSQLGKNNEFLYEYSNKGHLCVEGAPSKAADVGKIWVWNTKKNPVTDVDFGDAGTGTWQQKEDHRKDNLYSSDGKYSLDSDYNGKSYNGIGAIPSWLTKTEKPSQFHSLVNGEWVEDTEAKDVFEQDNERQWRDSKIASIEWIKQRHRDEVEQSIPTTISNIEYEALLAYIQELRDWPASVNFPQESFRPVEPEFISQQ